MSKKDQKKPEAKKPTNAGKAVNKAMEDLETNEDVKGGGHI